MCWLAPLSAQISDTSPNKTEQSNTTLSAMKSCKWFGSYDKRFFSLSAAKQQQTVHTILDKTHPMRIKSNLRIGYKNHAPKPCPYSRQHFLR